MVYSAAEKAVQHERNDIAPHLSAAALEVLLGMALIQTRKLV